MASGVDISFVTETGAACPEGTTVELWEGLMPAESGGSSTGSNVIAVSNGKAAPGEAKAKRILTANGAK